MYEDQMLWIAQADTEGKEKICILPEMANRHGLVAGATGTGKTITLKVLAETFADAGVPVFIADMKGDVAGLSQPGNDTPKMQELIAKYGFKDFAYRGYTTTLWDLFGEKGIPLRTTISDMGPTMLARLLDLNQTQEDILTIVFKIADDNGWLLLDMKDLRSMVKFVQENSKELSAKYGNMSTQSLGAISRSLLSLENQGANYFFGEPALEMEDWMRVDGDGRGVMNIMDATKLIAYPKLYATFMLWMLSELYENMPEAGDLDKPKIIFIFDEAHLLFQDAPKALIQKIEQIVKLIRSKGVGLYFCSQSPADIPDAVLSQLGNRIQHALRAYTPADQKAVKVAAQSFRPNPAFKTEEVITTLGTGEALVSFLDEIGAPGVVQKAFILCPQSRMGAITEEERALCINSCSLKDKYGVAIDRESAFEILTKQEEVERRVQEEIELREHDRLEKEREQKEKEQSRVLKKTTATTGGRTTKTTKSTSRTRQTALEKGVNSAMTSIGREVGRSLVRGLLNNLKK